MFDYSPIYIARTGSVDHWQDIWNTNASSLGTINIWLNGLADSLRFAFIGLFIGMTLAIPTAALASNRVVNSKSINGLTRIIVTLARAIPIVMLAGIISRFFDDGGEGAVTSIIILSLFVWVLFTKWLYEDMDDIPQQQITAMRASGLTKTQIFVAVVWPKILRRTISSTFYMFEIVFRFSAALAFVGLSGVGRVWQNLEFFVPEHYGHIFVVIALFVALFLIIEWTGNIVRRYLVNYRTKRYELSDKNFERFTNKAHSIRKTKPVVPRSISWIIFLTLLALVIWAMVTTNWSTASSLEIRLVRNDLRLMLNPAWHITRTWDINNPIRQALESVGIVILTFFWSIIFGVINGILASKKIVGRWISPLFRLNILIIRSLSGVVFVKWMMFLSPANNFAYAAVLGFAINSVGSLGKRMAIMIDSLPESKGKTMRTTGGSGYDTAMVSIAPDIIPGMISRSLYLLEINFKNLLLVGGLGISLFGAGFNNAVTERQYDVVIIYTIIYMVTSILIEWLASALRNLMEKPRKDRTVWSPFATKEKWLSFRIWLNIWVSKWFLVFAPKTKEKIRKTNQGLFKSLSELRRLIVKYENARIMKLAYKHQTKLKDFYKNEINIINKDVAERKQDEIILNKEGLNVLEKEKIKSYYAEQKQLKNNYRNLEKKAKDNIKSIKDSFDKGAFDTPKKEVKNA